MSALNGIAGYAGASSFVGAGIAAAFATRRPQFLGRQKWPPDVVYLGRVGRRTRIGLGLDELQQGILIAGSPGAGKTTVLIVIDRRLPAHLGCLFIDLKGDKSLPAKLNIPPERVFGLGDRCSAAWNPLGDGNPASWRDVLMSTQEWSEPHYRAAAARFLGIALNALKTANVDVELDDVIELLEQPMRAKGLMMGLDEREKRVLERTVDVVQGDASLRSGVLGLANRLALLRDSPATQGRFGASGSIDLKSVLFGDRVLFSLPAAEFPDEAPAIAAAVIQSFGAAAQRYAFGDEELCALLMIDEAAQLGGGQLGQAIAICRGAGVGTVVSVQDHANLDFVLAGTREAVETGANTWITMRQVASAESIGMALGSRTVKRQTTQRDSHRLFSDTGMRSEREVEEFRVSPNVIRGLGMGEAIVWRRLRGGRIDRVKIAPATGAETDGPILSRDPSSERRSEQ